ncbi:methyltransferase domain-containing protein [Flavobacterium sp.]|uniref:methyltransferase domain-containing protein n=1 Tax=Flavobacterium sp. TaxID=239 RepID=UPI00403460E8
MNPILDYYNALAKDYDADRFGNSYGQFIDKQERQVLDKLLKDANGTIVDLACGSGRLLDHATFGVDGSSEMVYIAKSKFPNKEVFLSDAGTLPFADASIDTIISFHFFMHLDEATIANILTECHRVISPGGRIIFDIPSIKRRRLLNYKSNNWHGATGFSFNKINEITRGKFKVRSAFGLMFFPIHRFPKGLRRFLGKADAVIANSFLKEYSSYLVVECVKL